MISKLDLNLDNKDRTIPKLKRILNTVESHKPLIESLEKQEREPFHSISSMLQSYTSTTHLLPPQPQPSPFLLKRYFHKHGGCFTILFCTIPHYQKFSLIAEYFIFCSKSNF